jgi:hypothetical protein
MQILTGLAAKTIRRTVKILYERLFESIDINEMKIGDEGIIVQLDEPKSCKR